ncbi:hypothetical protein [Cytobacillus praedii]|uniref:Uncharacterized protein n=1 Tax=Cytobacillus praedii TaxID=1742358 RepID=A0A4R1AJ66_9BACI|nr:hypothetical protein [Cytobacillus praedii]TCI99591.1 hypothetical protein E0Y62_27265 [Cytobacillus praedii]
MKLKILGVSIISIGIFSNSISAFAQTDVINPEEIKGMNGEPVIVNQDTDGILTISNAENPEEVLSELDKAEADKYYEEIESALGAGGKPLGEKEESTNEISTRAAEECISQCSEAYRYGTKTGSNGSAEAFTSIGGYHWYWGKSHWTGVHGGVVGKWKGTGTAKFIRADHTLEFSGWSMSISWPPSFSESGSSASYVGEKAYNVNSHISQFSGSEADGSMLGDLTHVGSALVRGSDGQDYRPIAIVDIN